MTLSAEELYRRGVEHGNAGRNTAARRALTAASARTDDADLRARIAGTLSYIASRTGDAEGAERLCREALEADGVSAETRAILHGQLGLIALHRGDLAAAAELLTVGIEGAASDPYRRASMYLNRSVVGMRSGRLAAARADLDAAIAGFRETDRAQDAAMAEHNLGYILLLEGDLVAALTRMAAARSVLATESAVNAAFCDLDRAEVLRDAGLVTEAERLLDGAARVFGAHRMRQFRGETELNLARSLLRHDPARAAHVAAAAERRFRALGSEHWAVRADSVRLRALLSAGAVGRTGRVIGEFGRVPSDAEIADGVAALEKHGLHDEAVGVRLTRGLWRTRHGMPDGAAPRPRRTAPIEVRLLSHEVRAANAGASGRLTAARRHAARGIDELAEWKRSFGSLDLQTSIAMHGHGLLLEGIGAAVRSGRPAVAFEWAERARHFSMQGLPLRPPPDPELAADLAELRMLRTDLPAHEWLADPRATEIGERVRARQWATGAGEIEDRVEFDEFRSALDAETALLAYIFGPDGLTCLVVTSDAATLIDIPDWEAVRAALPGLRSDLDMAASVRTGPMSGVVSRSLDTRLATLSRALLDGPLALTDARRLVVTVPGVLSGMPWSMLPGMRGRAFTLAVSASRWAHARLGAAQAAEQAAEHRATTAAFAAGPRVRRGDEEVGAAASAWRSSRVLRGADSTVDAVASIAADVDVLHIAAHGRHAVDNALFSGLELADGALFGYDIDRMPRVPRTIVLSACEVGRSSVRWGEEAVGMTRAWLHAGTHCVVAAPVVVADDVACALLAELHTGLADGQSPAEALAAASDRTGLVAPFQCHGSGF